MDGQRASQTPGGREVATLGGGCFWCLEAVFVDLNGVEKVESGYAGGHVANPTYRQVCGGDTGHAEVAQITFDPKTISYREILEVFFAIHDPTTLNRQGPERWDQYRSVIYYHSPEQKATAEQMIDELAKSKKWKSPIVTQVEPLKVFYPAEDYHRDYFARNPNQPYCAFVVAPKVAKAHKLFPTRLKV